MFFFQGTNEQRFFLYQGIGKLVIVELNISVLYHFKTIKCFGIFNKLLTTYIYIYVYFIFLLVFIFCTFPCVDEN